MSVQSIAGELNSLNLSAVVGGPLAAAVESQFTSALKCLQYVRSLGFQDGRLASGYVDHGFEWGAPLMVSIEYTKPASDGNQKQVLEVPFLTMIPLPCLLLTEFYCKFNAKVNSQSVTEIDESVTKSRSSKVGLDLGIVACHANVSVSSQESSHRGGMLSKEYHCTLEVKAKFVEAPSGITRLLDLLEELQDDADNRTSEPASIY